ncbi:MAG: DUF2306 domain-containing protein [Planctomycetes bacterium]|nr:DUF2306 domain-containing protein [Planctomycetota bacterium]
MITPAAFGRWRPLAWSWPGKVAALVLLAGSLALIVQVGRYFTFDSRFAFFVERPEITADRVWRACFYLHVAGGILCLATSPLLLWNGVAGGRLALHRAVGRVHAVAALGWVGPTGLYMTAFAKGGSAGQVGFLLLGVWFIVTNLAGIAAIRRREVPAHVVWMVRSYALILSALTFRVLHWLCHRLGSDAATNYVVATWVSLVLAIVAGELVGARLASIRREPAMLQASIP